MEYMIMPLKRYADFSGRSRRMEYWMFTLFQLILFVLFFVMAGVLGSGGGGLGEGVLLVGVAIYLLGFFIPSIAVQVRRLHDQDKSGWYILLGFIPYIGSFILLYFMVVPGTPGDNEYGPDPKGEGIEGVFD